MIHYVDYSAEEIREDNFYKKVATVAHNCYQVVGKTRDEIFVRRLIENCHLAMTEHYLFHFAVSATAGRRLIDLNHHYLEISALDDGRYLVTCSIRPLLEATGDVLVSLAPLVAALPEEIRALFGAVEPAPGAVLLSEDEACALAGSDAERHRFISIRFITDRGVSHELVRHRPCSFAQESTRYCNYSKEKFSSSLAVMRPVDYDAHREIYDRYFQEAENGYFALLESGVTPDVARALLPNALKTSIIVTASISEWRHIFELRLAPAAHRDMRFTMENARAIFCERSYI